MASKFEMKKWEIEEFGEIYEWLSARIESYSEKFMKLDELEQKTEWNSETKHFEPVWEDEEHTIPVMVNKWGNVIVDDDDLDENVIAKRRVCEKLREFIDKQV